MTSDLNICLHTDIYTYHIYTNSPEEYTLNISISVFIQGILREEEKEVGIWFIGKLGLPPNTEIRKKIKKRETNQSYINYHLAFPIKPVASV